jgi:hypothetical protein
VRQNGGVTAAKQRRTGGESAAEEFSCRSGALFSFSFSLILDEGGFREGWSDSAYSSPATAEP